MTDSKTYCMRCGRETRNLTSVEEIGVQRTKVASICTLCHRTKYVSNWPTAPFLRAIPTDIFIVTQKPEKPPIPV